MAPFHGRLEALCRTGSTRQGKEGTWNSYPAGDAFEFATPKAIRGTQAVCQCCAVNLRSHDAEELPLRVRTRRRSSYLRFPSMAVLGTGLVEAASVRRWTASILFRGKGRSRISCILWSLSARNPNAQEVSSSLCCDRQFLQMFVAGGSHITVHTSSPTNTRIHNMNYQARIATSTPGSRPVAFLCKRQPIPSSQAPA